MKKWAFTLGEVLITLTIIGVVVMLFAPSMVSNTADKARMTALKGTMLDLNNAMQSYMIKHHLTNLESMEISPKYGVPFIVEYTYDQNDEMTDFDEKLALKKNEDGTIKEFDIENINYNSLYGKNFNSANFTSKFDSAKVYLNNGVGLAFCSTATKYDNEDFYEILIDVNGNEPPNVIGLDAFVAYLAIETNVEKAITAGQLYGFPEPGGQAVPACNGGDGKSCLYLAEQSGYNPKYHKQ